MSFSQQARDAGVVCKGPCHPVRVPDPENRMLQYLIGTVNSVEEKRKSYIIT